MAIALATKRNGSLMTLEKAGVLFAIDNVLHAVCTCLSPLIVPIIYAVRIKAVQSLVLIFFFYIRHKIFPYFISKYRSLINQYQFILPQKLLGCIGTTSRSSNMPLVDASERRKSSARSNTLLGNINTYNTYNNNNNNNNNNGIQSFQSEMECASD